MGTDIEAAAIAEALGAFAGGAIDGLSVLDGPTVDPLTSPMPRSSWWGR